MIPAIERSPERDALIRATLPHVPALGWTRAAMAAGLRDLGEPPEVADSLFPTGPTGLLEAWCDLADRDMAETAAREGRTEGLRTPQRIRALLALRLEQAAPHREAVRRAVALLALPWNARPAARTAARTADAVWAAAGDRSDDLSWYTRRATLLGLYASVLAFWLADASPGQARSLDFLDRQLARLGRLQRRGGARTPPAAARS
ncbi:COQ9 family protein [Roseomonas sp. OT10]|uniref:COQ9 family protein n=1 Tax=Roseomonas cutis TaxID=2897332 RepID=UPI001E2AED07|nr:COQ9 family protein [Roseomonas sp. OT10]UFN49656.1 COQ9 family protein [Roseomonas sp. OT10]